PLLSYLIPRRPPSPPLFPYTTLFRSLTPERSPESSGPIESSRAKVGFPPGYAAVQTPVQEIRPVANPPAVVYKEPSQQGDPLRRDRKSTRLNSSHDQISYAVFCLKKK